MPPSATEESVWTGPVCDCGNDRWWQGGKLPIVFFMCTECCIANWIYHPTGESLR